MILRSLALLIFFFLSVVLYYQNLNLQKENERLKTKLLQVKPSKYEILYKKEFVELENNETEILKNELELCKQKLNLKTIETLKPQIKQDSKKEIYQKFDHLSGVKPIYNEINETKKDYFKVRPDFDYDKKTQDMSLRVEVQKNF